MSKPTYFGFADDTDTASEEWKNARAPYPTATKTAITLRAADLDRLVALYLSEQPENSAACLRQTFMKEFIEWVRRRETSDDANGNI